MSNTPPPSRPASPVPKLITLPEDEDIRLFVLSEASNLVITEMFSDVIFDNEIHVKQISALTRMGRDLQTAFEQRMAAEKRERGLIDDVPTQRIIKRPPNSLTLLTLGFVAIFVLAYGQYSGNLGPWTNSLYANSGYIIVGILLLIAFAFVIRFRKGRRRP